MSNTITIDLDSLSTERAEKLAGFILTYAGCESDEEPQPMTIAEKVFHLGVQSLSSMDSEPSPAEVFSQPSTISPAGPQLVIPNPTSPAPIAPMTAQPSQVADNAVGIPAVSGNTGIVVDKEGLPWDSRIHSSAKTFNSDGTWRSRRGLADGYVPKIEAELRQLMAIPSPAAVQQSATISIPSATANIPPPPPVQHQPLPPATASPTIQPYLDLMNKVSSALAGAKISQPQLQKVCDAVGLPNFVSLGTRLDLVPVVAPMIEGILAGTAV